MALIVPFLLLIFLGVLEFGMGWRSSLTVSNGVRAGARVGSSSANDRSADYDILQSVRSAMAAATTSQIQRIVVYKSDTADGRVPGSCLTSGSQSGVCNVYAASDLTRPAADFTGACSGAPDGAWCPLTREVRQSSPSGPDFLGVYLQYRHTYVTNMFPGGGITISDPAVMRLEPR
jgi:hypothetical protein